MKQYLLLILVIFILESCKKDPLAENYAAANSVKIISPGNAIEWTKDSSYTIEWNSTIESQIKIELFRAEQLVNTISSVEENDGNYSWRVPHFLYPDTTYRIKISSVNNSNLKGYSYYFKIKGDTSAKAIIPLPLNYNNWIKGADSLITWSDNLTEDMKIDLYLENTFISTITASTPSDSSYLWQIPSNLATNSKYRFKFSSITDNSIYSYSDYLRISTLAEMNLVKNGSFNTLEDWTISNPSVNSKFRWNIIKVKGNGVAEVATLQSSGRISQVINVITGQTYIVSYTLDKSSGYFGGTTSNPNSSAAITCSLGGSPLIKNYTVGTHIDTITAAGTSLEFSILEYLPASPNKGFVCTLDNVEVVPL